MAIRVGERITSLDNRPEKVIRRSLWRQWSIVIALTAWIVWFIIGNSIIAPISITLIGVGAGWIFGYKLGFGPVFSSTYFFGAEKVIEPTKK